MKKKIEAGYLSIVKALRMPLKTERKRRSQKDTVIIPEKAYGMEDLL